MMDYSRPVLNKNIWGMHINSARFLDHPPQYPDWLNPYQQKEWQDCGFVLWDATNRMVTHVSARYALRMLSILKETESWKTKGFIVGSPAYHILIPNTRRKKKTEETRIETPTGEWVLTNKIELSSERAAELLEFLTAGDDTLKQIAIDEDREAREALGKVYGLLAEYGRKIRQAKENGKEEERPKKRVIPTALPKGKYFTIFQVAEICNMTGRQIKKWIRSRELEYIDLPGLGSIIEAEKLNKFLNEKGIENQSNSKP